MADMVAESPDEYLEKLNFRSEICISCDWRRIDLVASTKARSASPARLGCRASCCCA